ncbi:PEP-CTERM sorting domain-containing protein [Aquabacterium sp.]|uniref:PEP-CTERM sorting domain-containing protein n=1 Tax=Aquabacterium sp. TaxID=1872578 RepID=UPI00248739E7|nr:PEP-CTERM sorting domain-containing protein [Aquabacterium sp.]MDI1349941.1 PEP-CTERM sorting domain-containing protein [Aquabacterium sp.]
MSILRSSFVAASFAFTAIAAQAATVIPVTQDGSWYAFTVDALSAQSGGVEWIDSDYDLAGGAGDFQALSFTFTVADKAILKLVDAYTAGDTYNLSITSASGTTAYTSSSVAARDLNDAVLPSFNDSFDGAFADSANFSQLTLTLGAGTYTVTGALLQSVTVDGFALNSTAGGLSVTAVPEPTSLALVLAAAGVVGVVSRRRARG